MTSCCITRLFDNVILYTITSCCILQNYLILLPLVLNCIITVLYLCGSPNRKESSPNSSSTICCKLEPPSPSSPRPPRSCGLGPSSVQVQLPVSVHRLTCATLYARSLLCSGRQSLLRLGSFFVPSSKLFPHLPTSRKHSSLVLWSGSVGGCIREIPRMLTEALVAELSVCVAFGWSLYEIFSVQKFHQSRHLAKTKLHPEYPHRKQMNPALEQEIGVFFEPEHPKKHATIR